MNTVNMCLRDPSRDSVVCIATLRAEVLGFESQYFVRFSTPVQLDFETNSYPAKWEAALFTGDKAGGA